MNAMSLIPPLSTLRSATKHAKTVLVVDDFEPICDLVAWHLSAVGYHVLTANGPEEAQRIVESPAGRNIDLLLTDLEMPGMSGDDLAQWFSTERPNAQVLFMSSWQPSYPSEAGVLQKPFSLTSLTVAVKTVFGFGVCPAGIQ